MSIHGRAEKHPLAFVEELFGLLYEKGDVCALAVQVFQALPLDGIVALILVGAVDGPFEVYYIAMGGKGDAAENPQDFPHIALLSVLRIYSKPKLNIRIKGVDVLLHAQHIDFLVHLQHFLKKAKVGILQHQEATLRLPDDPVFQKIFQPAAILG